MAIEIQGIEFSGFPGRDFGVLQNLNFAGRVIWVEYRVNTFFLDTFDRLVRLERDSYVWLCVISLLSTAVEALAHFEFNDRSGMRRFSRFVEQYFGRDFSTPMNLQEPANAIPPRAVSPAEQLYKYFRSGLAHSFCIEWGGLLHLEDGAPSYLFEVRVGHSGERALGIAPRELVADFRHATAKYFEALKVRKIDEPEFLQFNARFSDVYLNKARRPLP